MIQVLERAMNIIEFLGNSPKDSFPLSEIASKLDLDKGTCSRIVKTLCSRGFIQQEVPRGGYQIGYKLYHITSHHVENFELTKVARKNIDLLAESLNETVLLAVVRNDKRIVLYSTTPQRNLIIKTNLERTVYSVCAGRVIMANYTPSHLEKCIIRLGLPEKEEWPEIYESENPKGALMNEFSRIKKNGYDILEDGHGIIGFAAPLFQKGHVVGCVGTYLPVIRMTDKNYILDELLQCVKEINQKLVLQ